jgi:uncharacterized protein involved in response to NO
MTPAVARGPGPGPWHWRHLLAAPHRLGFFFGMLVLGSASAWGALAQLQRSGWMAAGPIAGSPSLVPGAVMTFGFFPLFFSGFLFTAGPRWLGVRGPGARSVLPLLAAQTAGWLLWLAGSHLHHAMAVTGLLLALGGLCMATLRFWGLVRASAEADRLHPKTVGAALVVGCLSLAGLAVSVLANAATPARLFVLTGLWGCVAVVFVAVGHRMIPFFTSPPVPLARGWRDTWLLWLMAGTGAFEAMAGWVDLIAADQPVWRLARGLVEAGSGGMLLASAAAWGLQHRMHIRLMAMLHIGFLWIGLALALQGAALLLGWLWGEPVLPLAGLHAFAMGALGSLMLAMVTRVSAAHSGQSVVADTLVWTLFWLLQAATLMRIAAAANTALASALLTGAAILWAALMLTWGVRYGSGYGRPFAAPHGR